MGPDPCDLEVGQITSTKIPKLTSKILKITSTFNQKIPQNFKILLKARYHSSTQIALKEHI